MEEIDISQLLSFFKSKIIYIVFAISMAFCLSSIYVNRFRIPEYTSSTTILLNQANENVQISTNDMTLNKSLVPTYGEIIKSKRVINQAIESLALDMTYSELSDMISVGEITDTAIIRISVTNRDNELASKIANSIADVFSKEIVEIYNIENISIIDVAEVNDKPSSASTLKIIGISSLAGAFLSIAVIFVLFYFDTTIKNEEDIERCTGLPVIGIVPTSREKIKYSTHRQYYDNLAKKHKNDEILPIEKKVEKIEENTKVREDEIGVRREEKYNNLAIEEEIKPKNESLYVPSNDNFREERTIFDTIHEQNKKQEIPILDDSATSSFIREEQVSKVEEPAFEPATAADIDNLFKDIYKVEPPVISSLIEEEITPESIDSILNDSVNIEENDVDLSKPSVIADYVSEEVKMNSNEFSSGSNSGNKKKKKKKYYSNKNNQNKQKN